MRMSVRPVSAMRMYETFFKSANAPASIPAAFRGLEPSSDDIIGEGEGGRVSERLQTQRQDY